MKTTTTLLLFFLTFQVAYSQQTEKMYLSGKGTDDAVLWDFYCTAGRNSEKWSQIPVPSNWEFHGFGEYTYGHDRQRTNESGKYRYRFTVPADWKNKKVNIVFDGSMTDTEVSINGKKAGKIHQGAFYRFRYDISKLIKYGSENLLEVTVHKASSNKTVEAAERAADFWVFGGIFRPVWLEALPAGHIERVAIDARCDGDFSMDVFLGKAAAGYEVSAQVKTADGKPFGQEMRIAADKKNMVNISTAFNNPKLWSSEFPNMYSIDVSLSKNGVVEHRISEKFGFRTAELRPGDGFYVNNVKIKFKGVDRHTTWPTSGRATNDNVNLNDALLIKEMNMNAVRMSHYPPDKSFLEICDSLGLYVIDELTAWQSPAYDTEVGTERVMEMITRDVNHPSVVMWANGNEGGFNFELLPVYKKYDIQDRLVIHPWLEEENVATFHYMSYGVGTNFYFEGNKVFFPTEFIHGLYDGGHGAGLDDYWNLMRENPLSAGGFLWDFADQGIVREDKGNIIDTDGNHAADGIVGPYREKEGSFYTIKEIWSPVFLEGTKFIPPSFDGKIKVRNYYHFTNLNQCSFTAEWVSFDYPSGKKISKLTKVTVPDVEPSFSGILTIEMPDDFAIYDALYIKAVDPWGKEIYTWSRTISKPSDIAAKLTGDSKNDVNVTETSDEIAIKAGKTLVAIDKNNGTIKRIDVNGKVLPLTNGPRFTNDIFDKPEIAVQANVIELSFKRKNENRQRRNRIKISLLPSEWVCVDYTFDVGGQYDHIGVTFDFPEKDVKSVKWLGNGPYRVWKNRMKGVTFNIWEKDYNNTITGESWEYPEFKGFHSNLYAADITLGYGKMKIVTASENLFLHLLTPENPVRRNNDNTLGIFPDGQISILNAISPVGTKFKRASELGPQSGKNIVVGAGQINPVSGKFYIKFAPEGEE